MQLTMRMSPKEKPSVGIAMSSMALDWLLLVV